MSQPDFAHRPVTHMGSLESVCATERADVPSATQPSSAPIQQHSTMEVVSLERGDNTCENLVDGCLYFAEASTTVSGPANAPRHSLIGGGRGAPGMDHGMTRPS